MSVGLSMPHDSASADDVMKLFNDKAYSRNLKPIFQEAVDILYRPNIFEVQEDNCGRMLFSCKLCNNDMNSHEALKQHHLSGKHQKNYDKKAQEDGISIDYCKIVSRSSRSYPPGSLQDRLLSATGTPIGLQMLEEYQNRGKSYYRCILCGAHGRLDAMYKHATGTKHTEKYIKASLELESSILSATERDTLARHIGEKYGRNAVDYIKIIRGNEYYPHKWEAEGKSQSLKNDKIKKRPLSPKRSEKRSPSSAFNRHRSPSLEHKSRRHRSPSPTNSPYSRGRSSQSPQPSTSRSRYSESPPRRRHREKHDSETSHRNRSPPPSSRGGPRTPPPMSRGRARTPPAPPPPSLSSIETKVAEVQKVDLEELMVQLNFLVKSQNMSESDLKTDTDLDLAIRMMWNISLGLFYINKNQKESEDQPSHVRDTLNEQMEVIQKILGHLRNYMGPEAGLELHENGIKKLRNRHQNY